MKLNKKGYIEDIAIIVVPLLILAFMCGLSFVSFKSSNEVVSGIVYNTQNDKFISGNTTFSVRASEATYTNESNESSYCLPPNSQYKSLVNKAAGDKRIKIEVEERKYFTIQSPFTCKNNVSVKEIK